MSDKARLTYRYSPTCIVNGQMVRDCWYTVYDRAGRIVIVTKDKDKANQAVAQFDEMVEAELEDLA